MSGLLLVPNLSVLLQGFFCQRLLAQRRASPQTVASYRDAFRLLLRYAHERTGKPPVALTLEDLDAPLILGFLNRVQIPNCMVTPPSVQPRVIASVSA